MAIDWEELNNAVGDGVAESGNTVNGDPVSSSSGSSSGSSSSGNPSEDELMAYHDKWGDTTTSFEDAAGPSYEEQIASEAISSGGRSLDSLEQDISRLPNTTLGGVKAEFEKMIASSDDPTNEPATNEPAVPSILPENWPSLFGQGQDDGEPDSVLLVAGVLAVGLAVSVLGGR